MVEELVKPCAHFNLLNSWKDKTHILELPVKLSYSRFLKCQVHPDTNILVHSRIKGIFIHRRELENLFVDLLSTSFTVVIAFPKRL